MADDDQSKPDAQAGDNENVVPPAPLEPPALHSASPPSSPIEPEQPADFRPHPGFWQRPAVVNAISFGTSLLVHLSVIIVGVVLARTVPMMITLEREQIIIPDATIVEGAEVGGIPNPGLGGDPTREVAQDQFADVVAAANSWADRPSQSLTSSLMGGGSGEGASDSVIGIGSGRYGAGRGTGNGQGTGIGAGSGDAGGGALAPFGVPGGGGGIGPKSPFMGISGNATTVVYLCDASGSMINKIDLLKYELRKAISSLKPIQACNIVLFKEGEGLAANKSGLIMATPANKSRLYEFIDQISVAKNSDPYAALKIAFAGKPQLIYMLSDGDFDMVAGGNEAIRGEIKKLNSEHRTKINTIAMDRGDMFRATYTLFLKELAEENGGTFKFVAIEDLGG